MAGVAADLVAYRNFLDGSPGSLASHGCVAAGSLAAISALQRLVSPTVSRLTYS